MIYNRDNLSSYDSLLSSLINGELFVFYKCSRTVCIYVPQNIDNKTEYYLFVYFKALSLDELYHPRFQPFSFSLLFAYFRDNRPTFR